MIQQVLAIFLILFFLSRLFWQKQKKHISGNEFIFWLIFWLLAVFAMIFIKSIDSLVASFGFSGSGIEVLLYLGIALLFYFIFRLRLKLEKIEKDITEIVRHNAINKK